MGKRPYSVGLGTDSWRADKAQTVTFIVTDDCNLRCKYCYITHKSSDRRMDFSVAKRFVDELLHSDALRYQEAVILDFIGGEPFMETELIDKICDYFKIAAFRLQHPWYWNYRISICTNGVNYSSDAVQRFIQKNRGKISLSITLDGTKEKHDLQRVFPDGRGSWDAIEKSIDLWISQFPGSTKVTFASEDLPLLKESILSLWDRGVLSVSSNVVFEDVWKEGDDRILEEQLCSLADYVLDHQLYNTERTCSFFDDSIGFPYRESDLHSTYCGAGKMVAVSPDGKLYPCLRYYGHSLNHHEEWPVGDLEQGVDMEKVRPFVLASNSLQSDDECLNCPIATGCAFCQGFNYDEAATPTNFYRAKYICNMHKARVRANEYYFSKLWNRYGIERQCNSEYKRYLFFLLSEDYSTYCAYENTNTSPDIMEESTIQEGLVFARNNFFRPIFVHPRGGLHFQSQMSYEIYDIVHIIPAEFLDEAKEMGFKRILPVFHKESLVDGGDSLTNSILNIKAGEIGDLFESVEKVRRQFPRVNVHITQLDKNFDEILYKEQLCKIKEALLEDVRSGNPLQEINLLTDILYLAEHDNCMAGEHTFVLSPGGDLHTCCGEYASSPDGSVGNLQEGFTRDYDKRLYKIKNSNLCLHCDAYQCKVCIHTNKKFTKEVNVSPSFQCRKSHIEREVSQELLKELDKIVPGGTYVPGKRLEKLEYLDPIEVFFRRTQGLQGYYKYKKA